MQVIDNAASNGGASGKIIPKGMKEFL